MFRNASFKLFSGESRAPHGARGLKLRMWVKVNYKKLSRPARGAWIEMNNEDKREEESESRPARGAWIEICKRRTI